MLSLISMHVHAPSSSGSNTGHNDNLDCECQYSRLDSAQPGEVRSNRLVMSAANDKPYHASPGILTIGSRANRDRFAPACSALCFRRHATLLRKRFTPAGATRLRKKSRLRACNRYPFRRTPIRSPLTVFLQKQRHAALRASNAAPLHCPPIRAKCSQLAAPKTLG